MRLGTMFLPETGTPWTLDTSLTEMYEFNS